MRGQALNKLADLIDENKTSIAYLESICSGRPLGMLLDEVPRVSSTFRCKSPIVRKVSFPVEAYEFQKITLGGQTRSREIPIRPRMGFTRSFGTSPWESVRALQLGMHRCSSVPGNLHPLWQQATP